MEQQKEWEVNSHRTERALKTLSACNGALVRATNESGLLAELCRVIIEKGGHRLVWVGFAEDNQTKTVRLAAHAGHDDGFLDRFEVNWDETSDFGRGPTGIAIRSGQIAICHDFQTDPTIRPWLAEVTKHGYASCISLPLRLDNAKVFGVVTIYSAVANAFNAIEVDLLQELAEDLAYGIQALRIRSEHDRGQATLRESEQKFSKMFHASPTAMSLSSIQNGTLLDVNDEFLKLYQRSRAEVIGHTSVELSIWDNPNQRKAIVAKILDNSAFSEFELKTRTKSGQLREILWSVEAVDVGGQKCLLGSALDITERKLADQSLRESAVFVREVLDALSAHIAVLDEHGIIVAVNQAWRKFAEENGGDDQRMLLGANYLTAGQPWRDLPANENASEALAGIQAVLNGNRPSFQLEYACHASGSHRWFVMHVWPLGGKRKGVVVAHENITERKRAEAQVNLQFSALSAAANAIVITDRTGKIEWVNPAFSQLTGYGGAEIIGHSPRRLKSGQHPPEFYTKMWTTITAGKVWNGELVNKRKDGSLYYETTTITPVLGEHRQITHFVSIKQDISEQRKLEEQLRQSQKMEAIGQLAGGVAHDFNNILSALLIQAQLVEMIESLPEEAMEGLKQIRADANRAADLTRQLLLFSRRQVIQLRNLDLNKIVTNLAKLLQRIIGEDVRLQINLHPLPLITRVDAGMLEQVLMNLAVNARDAMPGGGCLRIETTGQTVTESSAGLSPDAEPGHYVCFSVSDTGSGIPPQILSKIFEPFFTTKAAGKGTGLGLATVFGIVKQHRGWIKVDNQPGSGVTFRVYLPASLERAIDTNEPMTKNKLGGGNETILLVEDEASVRRLICKMLERQGYQIMLAANGIEALELWQRHHQSIALLLTDLIMPGGINGHELAHQLVSKKPGLKIIYISGYSAQMAGKELQLGPGENFVQKPFGVDQILATIRSSLDN